jgi:5-methyltetrahydrofolate--homocysteine methyltransferase
VGKAIAARDAEFLKNLAVRQTEAGANFIDVCASVEPAKELETLKWMLEIVQDATDVPICIDSPNPDILVDVLKAGWVKKPGLVNSVSMEGDKVSKIFPLIADSKWEVVALLCDDTGIPKTAQKRKEVFDALLEQANKYNIAPNRLHIDPLVEMLATSYDTDNEDATGIAVVVDVMKYIRAKSPTIHITGAISNISFNLPGRKIVNMAFAVLAMNAGLDSAVFDPLDKVLLGVIFATEACLGMDDFCMEYISAHREERIAAPSVAKKA